MYFIGDEEIEALKNLFEKKRLYRYQSAYQSECDLFEKEFCEYINSPYSLLLTSGTNALYLALVSSGVQPGDEVMIPAYTFVATAAAVLHAGAIPILINIDEQLSLDFSDAEAKLTTKTKAVILVHMDGLVANVSVAKTFCSVKSLVLIEDVAQAIGADFEGKKLGTHGDYGCYSLNESKNISCGEGGILITKLRSQFEKAFCLHDGPSVFSPSKKSFYTEINPILGLSMRVSEIQGAIMRVQLRRLEIILAGLRQRKSIFKEHLSSINIFKIVEGYSDQECASSLHFQFKDPLQSSHYRKKLSEIGILLGPVTARPAHASWKWSHLLNSESQPHKNCNPYFFSEKKYDYSTMNYLQSVEILTKTEKFEIDLHLTLDHTIALAGKMKEIFLS